MQKIWMLKIQITYLAYIIALQSGNVWSFWLLLMIQTFLTMFSWNDAAGNLRIWGFIPTDYVSQANNLMTETRDVIIKGLVHH